MRDYQQRQEHAHEDTFYLVGALTMASFVLVAATSLIMAAAVGGVCYLNAKTTTNFGVPEGFLQDQIVGWLLPSVVLNVIIVAGTMIHRISQIRQNGGRGIAEDLGANRIVEFDATAEQKQLMNVVDEMSIAAGIRRPSVYIIDDPAINGFAAGHNEKDAIVAVTQGAVDKLTRDQLQGVIAHEFSHVIKNDIELNTKLIGTLAGLRALSSTAEWCFQSAKSAGVGANPGALILGIVGVFIYPIGRIGQLLATLILFSVTRQREYLADAHAVQLTRNPYGLREALQVIAAENEFSRVSVAGAESVSHLFFADMRGIRGRLFSTHPPIQERIARLYDGQTTETSRESGIAESNSSPVSIQ